MSYLYYTCALSLVIFSIYRPFITKLDKVKYVALGAISFLIPFVIEYNNTYHINHGIQFPRELNLSSSMHSPSTLVAATFNAAAQHLQYMDNHAYLLTDAFVLLMMTALTVSVHGLFTRWHFPVSFIKPNSNIYLSGFMRYGISIFNILLAILCQYASHYKHSLTFTLIGFLWYISGPYFVRRWKLIAAVTLISAAFGFSICCTAYTQSILYTLSFSNWVSSAFILVLACNSLDYLDAILNTYPYLVQPNKLKQAQLQDATSFIYWVYMFRLICALPSECELDPSPIEDLETAIKVLGPASRSWKTMAALFPVNLRQDLCLLYAFFRTADDLVDDAPTHKQCTQNLVTIRKFLRDVFSPAKPNELQSRDSLPSHVNWDHYASLLPNEEVLTIFKNFARISHYLCPRAMSELTDAWEHDLRGEPVRKQKDLLNYAALISGTFGELCTCVIMYKTGRGNWGQQFKNVARNEDVLARARATGQCLQLVNIARDVIADSLVGRCYVPLQYMSFPSENIYRLLKVEKTPYVVGEQTLKSFSLRILELADQISDKAQKGIDGLPEEVQDSIRAAFEIYMAIGPTLRNDPGFPLRTKVPKSQQQWVALRCIYGFRGPVARAVTCTFYEMVSLYSRAFARLTNTRKTSNVH